MRSDLVGHPRTLIADRDHIAARGAIQVDPHRGSQWCMTDRVVYDVPDHAADQLLVTVKRRRTNRQRIVNGDVLGRGDHARRAHNLVDELVEVHRRPSDRVCASIGACQCEHVIDDPRQPGSLLVDDLERFAIVLFTAMRLLEGHAGCRACRGDGRAQFVGGVGHELSLLDHRTLQPAEQLIERRCQATKLVARIDDGQALAQVLHADTPCPVRHGHDRRQTLTGEKPSAEAGNHKEQGHHITNEPPQGRKFLVEGFERTAEHHDVITGT